LTKRGKKQPSNSFLSELPKDKHLINLPLDPSDIHVLSALDISTSRQLFFLQAWFSSFRERRSLATAVPRLGGPRWLGVAWLGATADDWQRQPVAGGAGTAAGGRAWLGGRGRLWPLLPLLHKQINQDSIPS